MVCEVAAFAGGDVGRDADLDHSNLERLTDDSTSIQDDAVSFPLFQFSLGIICKASIRQNEESQVLSVDVKYLPPILFDQFDTRLSRCQVYRSNSKSIRLMGEVEKLWREESCVQMFEDSLCQIRRGHSQCLHVGQCQSIWQCHPSVKPNSGEYHALTHKQSLSFSFICALRDIVLKWISVRRSTVRIDELQR